MLLVDTLIVIGCATASLGTIHEADGVQRRSFWLRNAGSHALVLKQGYTSCGCTQINLQPNTKLAVGDSISVTLSFNPRGKGGEFYEQGTIVYAPFYAQSATETQEQTPTTATKSQNIVLKGTCITSEETLLKQFPIRLNDHLRLSVNRFDLGFMQRGESKDRGILVLHIDENNRKERIPIRFTIDESMPAGLQHITRTVTTVSQGHEVKINVTFDVIIL